VKALADLLIANGWITAEQAMDVLQSQAIYGGSYDTNLLELGLISEAELQPLLERAHLMHNRVDVYSPPTREAKRLLRPEQAAGYRVMPMGLAQRTLDVLVNDPWNLRVMDEIAFVTGCRIVTNVATEARIAHHLFDTYGIALPLRFANLLEGKTWPKPEIAARHAAQGARTAPQQKSGSLDDGDDAHGIRIGHVMPPAPAAPLHAPPTAPTLPPLRPPLAMAEAPAAAPPEPVYVAPPAPVYVAPPEPVRAAPPAPARMPVMTVTPMAPALVTPPPAPPPSVDLIAAQLEGISDRDQLPPIVLGYLSRLFERVVLFAVRKNECAGWDGRGAHLKRDLIEKIQLPVERPSIFHKALASASAYEGPLPHGSVEDLLLSSLGGHWPTRVVVCPLTVKERAVALVYGEVGSDAALTRAREPLYALVPHISQTLMRLVLEKKQKR
jgi:hypothetical protein